MSINGILLVAGTKFGPKFSRNFCSFVNSVSVKLMTACFFVYDAHCIKRVRVISLRIQSECGKMREKCEPE